MADWNYFLSLDLKDGYCQVELDEDYKYLTIFSTPTRRVCYNRLPQDQPNIIVYLDDLCAGAKTFEGLMVTLTITIILKRLRKIGAKLNGAKCHIGVTEINILGTIIDKNGARVDPKRYERVHNYPLPKTFTKLRSFLGLVSYCRRWLPDLAKFSYRLTKLTAHPKYEDPKQYFTIYSDSSLHGNLAMKEKTNNGRLARNSLKLQDYAMDLSYAPGTSVNQCINDKLDPLKSQIHNITYSGYQPSAISYLQQQDPFLSKLLIYFDLFYKFKTEKNQSNIECREATQSNLLKQIREKKINRKKSELKFFCKTALKCIFNDDNIIMVANGYTEKLFVPQALQSECLVATHDSPLTGHFGIKSTYFKLQQRYVKSCIKCQSRNSTFESAKRLPKLHFNYSPKLFDTCIIDVYAVTNASAKTVAQHLISKVLLKYSPIKILATDNAANFLSDIIKELCLIFKIEKLDCAGYHLAQIGRLERIHRSYGNYFSKFINENHNDWDKFLEYLTYAYNTNANGVTGFSPYEIVFNRPPALFMDSTFFKSTHYDKNVQRWINKINDRKKHLQNIIQRRNDYIENNITEEMLFHKLREFKINDQVYIKNETYDQGDNTSKKFQRRFDGSMIITKRLGEFTYKMKNPRIDKLPIRNIDKIKEYHGRVYNKNSFNYMDNAPFQ
eukprot:Pgem_evm3s2409